MCLILYILYALIYNNFKYVHNFFLNLILIENISFEKILEFKNKLGSVAMP